MLERRSHVRLPCMRIEDHVLTFLQPNMGFRHRTMLEDTGSRRQRARHISTLLTER